MSTVDKEIVKIYFTIGEVAEMLREPTVTVRFWTNEFHVPTKREKYNRRYNADAIEMLKDIQHKIRKQGIRHWRVAELLHKHLPKPIMLIPLNEEERAKLKAMGRQDLVDTHDILMSGYAGIDPEQNGLIVDRRVFPEALPIPTKPSFQ